MIVKLIGCLIVLSLIACIQLALRKHASLKSAAQFPGTVIGHLARRGSKGRTVYALQVEYQDKVGMMKQFATTSASNPASENIGDKVTVFEYPDGSNPDILVFEELFLGYWLWFCIGVAIAGCFAAPAVLRFVYLK